MFPSAILCGIGTQVSFHAAGARKFKIAGIPATRTAARALPIKSSTAKSLNRIILVTNSDHFIGYFRAFNVSPAIDRDLRPVDTCYRISFLCARRGFVGVWPDNFILWSDASSYRQSLRAFLLPAALPTRNCPESEDAATSTPLLPSQINLARQERRCRSTDLGSEAVGGVAPAASLALPECGYLSGIGRRRGFDAFSCRVERCRIID